MRGATVEGLLVVAILVGAGLGYLAGNSNQKTITSTTTEIGPTITQTTNASGVCVSNIGNLPQTSPQDVSILHQIIINPSLIQFSDGRCWTYEGGAMESGPGGTKLDFIFDHFSDKIYYPCGLFPAFQIDTQVYVVPTLSNGSVIGISIQPRMPLNGYYCPVNGNEIQPVWLNLVSWDPSGQTVSLQLHFVSVSGTPLRGLEVKIFNATWSYVIPFSDVNSTFPLQPGSYVTQEVLISGAPLRTGVVYNMTATGTYVNGTRVISGFYVQLQV